MGATGEEKGRKYSILVGFIFTFNLIVGTGALALPLAFQSSGLILGTIFLCILCFLSYITVTYMVECLAVANALSSNSAEEKSLVFTNEQSSKEGFMVMDYKINEESRYYIHKRVEVSEMAQLFLGKWGQRFFFVVIVIYLYGDLAIYSVVVPTSLLTVTGTWGSLSKNQVFWVYLSIFAVILVPFSFFDFQKTRYLQILTLAIRNLSLFGMIILAIVYDGKGEGELPEQWWNFSGFTNIFGTAIYAFMCHHSLPSIITPVDNQHRVKFMMLADNIFVLITYLLLCWTAVWAFGSVPQPSCYFDSRVPCQIQNLYTLNFAFYEVKAIGLFLVLYPVFTLSSNFPLICITLRNNLMQLVTYKKDSLPLHVRRVVFALLAAIPPLSIAFGTQNIKMLVDVTGAYAGLGIMFFFPALLVYKARQLNEENNGIDANNHFLVSPFKHVAWIYGIFAICAFSLVYTTFRQIQNLVTG